MEIVLHSDFHYEKDRIDVTNPRFKENDNPVDSEPNGYFVLLGDVGESDHIMSRLVIYLFYYFVITGVVSFCLVCCLWK